MFKYIIVIVLGLFGFLYIQNEVPRIQNPKVQKELQKALDKQIEILSNYKQEKFRGHFENIKEEENNFLDSRVYSSELIINGEDNRTIHFSKPKIIINIDQNKSSENPFKQKVFKVKIYNILPNDKS